MIMMRKLWPAIAGLPLVAALVVGLGMPPAGFVPGHTHHSYLAAVTGRTNVGATCDRQRALRCLSPDNGSFGTDNPVAVTSHTYRLDQPNIGFVNDGFPFPRGSRWGTKWHGKPVIEEQWFSHQAKCIAAKTRSRAFVIEPCRNVRNQYLVESGGWRVAVAWTTKANRVTLLTNDQGFASAQRAGTFAASHQNWSDDVQQAGVTALRVRADVTQVWCPDFGQSYPSCWVPRGNPGSNMITGDVTSSQQGKARFHFVANVSNSNWNHTGHAGPFALGTGWNKTYAGTPVYQVMENGGGCAIWHKGTHNTYWGNCTAGAKASLYAIRNSGLTISVGATNAYSGHSGDGNQPSVLTAEGFGNTVQTHSATSNRKNDQHWAR